jgi:hypothetical protein
MFPADFAAKASPGAGSSPASRKNFATSRSPHRIDSALLIPVSTRRSMSVESVVHVRICEAPGTMCAQLSGICLHSGRTLHDIVITDLRLAWRMFVSGRGASLLTVAMLAVAMAGTLTIFTVLTAMSTLWPDLPQRERLARIYASNPRVGAERAEALLVSFAQWAPQLTTFEAVAAFAIDDRTVDATSDVAAQAVTSR